MPIEHYRTPLWWVGLPFRMILIALIWIVGCLLAPHERKLREDTTRSLWRGED